ncbi:MAG: Tfp pilus assembly protein FimT/FimU [Nitrospirota bacterium]
MKEKTNNTGFTLIELVMIILLFGILSAVAIPQFNLQDTRGGAAGRRIVSDIRYAQQLSTTTQIVHGVIFTSASYTLFENDNTGDPAKDPLTGSDFIVNMNGDFAGVTLSSNLTGGIIKFDSIGAPLKNDGSLLSSEKTITVQSGTSSSSITIEPNTGKVTMN